MNITEDQKTSDYSIIYAYMKSRGENPDNIKDPSRKRSVMFKYSKEPEYKLFKQAHGQQIARKASERKRQRLVSHVEYDYEQDNFLNEEETMEINFTPFSQYIAESAVKEDCMEIVHSYVTENFEALMENAMQGDESAQNMINLASQIEDIMGIEYEDEEDGE